MMRAIAATLLSLALLGPAAADGMAMPKAHGAGGSPADAANAAAMHGMMSEMDVRPSGNPDKDFARMMLAHHRGAIAMAKVELDHGSDPEMRALATDIIKAQQAEITQMQGWLAKH